jgi:hypothetical protein
MNERDPGTPGRVEKEPRRGKGDDRVTRSLQDSIANNELGPTITSAPGRTLNSCRWARSD